MQSFNPVPRHCLCGHVGRLEIFYSAASPAILKECHRRRRHPKSPLHVCALNAIDIRANCTESTVCGSLAACCMHRSQLYKLYYSHSIMSLSIKLNYCLYPPPSKKNFKCTTGCYSQMQGYHLFTQKLSTQ